MARPATTTATETMVAGTTARLTGTRRPPRNGTHDGIRSPQVITRPRVSSAPTTSGITSIHTMSGCMPFSAKSLARPSTNSCETPIGIPRFHAARCAAYGSCATIAAAAAHRPIRAHFSRSPGTAAGRRQSAHGGRRSSTTAVQATSRPPATHSAWLTTGQSTRSKCRLNEYARFCSIRTSGTISSSTAASAIRTPATTRRGTVPCTTPPPSVPVPPPVPAVPRATATAAIAPAPQAAASSMPAQPGVAPDNQLPTSAPRESLAPNGNPGAPNAQPMARTA
jgi:hypothetical protein